MIVMTHNPACGTSRNVLGIVQAAGADPVVIEYLTEGWTRGQLLQMFAAADVTVREALRVSKSPAEELGLTDPSVPDEALLDAMVTHPILVNRPFVFSPKGVRLCRPSHLVLDVLDEAPKGFVLEDGTALTDDAGRRLIG